MQPPTSCLLLEHPALLQHHTRCRHMGMEEEEEEEPPPSLSHLLLAAPGKGQPWGVPVPALSGSDQPLPQDTQILGDPTRSLSHCPRAVGP